MNGRLQSDDSRVPASPTPQSPHITPHVSRFTFHVSRLSPLRSRRSLSAFSLLEVMIASGIFFMAVFTILALVSSVLRNARSLRRTELDAGMVAAQVTRTNKLYEGTESGDFGNLYPDYSWETDTYEVQTNGLYQVDIVVRRRGVAQPVDTMSIYVFSPDSAIGMGRPTFR